MSVPSETCVLPLLADPAGYHACQWDLRESDERRVYWLHHFGKQFQSLLAEAARAEMSLSVSEQDATRRADAARATFDAYLKKLLADPRALGRLDILTICIERERILREQGFADPYLLVKQRGDAAARKLLPAHLAELDALASPQLEQRIVEGVFAGNIFDVGALATLAIFEAGAMSFHDTRAKLKARPWLFDDLDKWLERMRTGKPHKAALIFADNAGFDVVMGILPLARSLLKCGTGVILAANTTPSLNDITAAELREMVTHVSEWDAIIGDAFRGGDLEIIASGCGTPLIDLSRVSNELAEACERRGVDLVVLEGMGRAVESNIHVPFTCDAIKIALIKDLGVATAFGGQMYDQVFKYEQRA